MTPSITGFDDAAPGRDRPGLLPRDDDGGRGDLHVLAARWCEQARRLRDGDPPVSSWRRARNLNDADRLDACAEELRDALEGGA